MLEIGLDSVRISECWRVDRAYIRRDIQVLEIGPGTYVGITECWKLDRIMLEYPNVWEWTGHICRHIRMLEIGPDNVRIS